MSIKILLNSTFIILTLFMVQSCQLFDTSNFKIEVNHIEQVENGVVFYNDKDSSKALFLETENYNQLFNQLQFDSIWVRVCVLTYQKRLSCTWGASVLLTPPQIKKYGYALLKDRFSVSLYNEYPTNWDKEDINNVEVLFAYNDQNTPEQLKLKLANIKIPAEFSVLEEGSHFGNHHVIKNWSPKGGKNKSIPSFTISFGKIGKGNPWA